MIKDLWLVLTGKLSSALYYRVMDNWSKANDKIAELQGELFNYKSAMEDPNLQRASDEIGQKAMARIMAEAQARRKMEGRG